MALWLQDGTRVKVQKITHKDNYTEANLSSSRKKANGEEGYLYSDWGFVRFLGKAHNYMLENVSEKDVLVLNKAMFTKEPFMKDGTKTYPKFPQLLVFDCELYQSTGKKAVAKKEEVPAEENEEIPF